MAEHHFIGALAEHWGEVLGSLESEDIPLFAEHVTRAAEAAVHGRASVHAVVDELMFLLGERLPSEHPVRQAIPGQGETGSSAADLFSAGSMLADLPLPLGRSTTRAAVALGCDEDPYDRLLSAPSLTEREVRESGVRAERDDLIRLLGTDRQHMLPAFQFGPDGQPLSIVTEVNLLLDAAGDPWGVADWWLGENPWLCGVPADMLGEVADTDLMQAALAALPEGPGDPASANVDVLAMNTRLPPGGSAGLGGE